MIFQLSIYTLLSCNCQNFTLNLGNINSNRILVSLNLLQVYCQQNSPFFIG